MSKPGFEKRGKLLGLGGLLRAGKDAVADHLASKHDFVKLGMSDALNDALLVLNPWVQLDFDVIPEKPWLAGLRRGKYHKGEVIRYADLHAAVGYTEAKRHSEVRRLLQLLGTEVGRKMISENVWVRIAENKIRALLADGQNVVLTATRFSNELDMIERLGGTTVWVNRPDEARGVSEGINEGHDSENSVSQDDFELTIENTGTLDDLADWTDSIVDGLSPKFAKGGYLPGLSNSMNLGAIREAVIPFAAPYDR